MDVPGDAAPDGTATLRERAESYSTAQLRTVEVALSLFGTHGVAGTSLQMIADELGVTKAAVYHQFRTKESIVVAVLDVRLQPLDAAVAAAEVAAGTPSDRTATDHAASAHRALEAIVEVVVADRHTWSTLQSDPVVLALLGEHEPSRHLWTRLFRLLVGDDRGPAGRVRAAVLSASIGSVGHPFVAEVPDDVLATELLSILTELAPGPAPGADLRRA